MIEFRKLKETLSHNNFPALCLAGNDRWIQKRALERIYEAYGVQDDGFGVDYKENATYKDIEEACLTPSMFSEKKVVVAENYEFPQGAKQSETIKLFSKLTSSCDGSFCLVFVSESPACFEKIANLEVVNCNRLDSGSIVQWITAYCNRQGVEVDSRSARKISDYCLQDMSRVEKETQKLIDYGEITSDSVELLVHKDTEYVVFNLSKRISEKNAAAALELYNGLIASGEDARGLFALLYNFYRRAYYVRTSEYPVDSLANYLNVKTYAVERAKEIADGYKPMQLKRILDCFDSADIKLKSFLDETEVMTALIMQIVAM